jgi:uncharacterized protein YndB with AHSA1/START domain
MKIPTVDSPDPKGPVCKEKTGRTMKQWFTELDEFGGLEKGRRAMTQHVYDTGGKDAWWSTTIAVEYERSRGQKDKDGAPTGYSICSTKTIAAPLGKVLRAFSDAKTLDRWLGPKTRIDFVDGGRYENADGNRGTFKRIRPDKDIRLTWDHAELAPGSAVEVLFADKGKGRTGITLNHTRLQTRREADLVREGWSTAFNALKGLLEE